MATTPAVTPSPSDTPALTDEQVAEVVTGVTERGAAWFKCFGYWRFAYWSTGIVAATASALAAATKVTGESAPWFAVTSSICIAFIGFANPQRRSNGYVAAWRVVDATLRRFAIGDADVRALVSSVERGEAIIADADNIAGKSKGSEKRKLPKKPKKPKRGRTESEKLEKGAPDDDSPKVGA